MFDFIRRIKLNRKLTYIADLVHVGWNDVLVDIVLKERNDDGSHVHFTARITGVMPDAVQYYDGVLLGRISCRRSDILSIKIIAINEIDRIEEKVQKIKYLTKRCNDDSDLQVHLFDKVNRRGEFFSYYLFNGSNMSLLFDRSSKEFPWVTVNGIGTDGSRGIEVAYFPLIDEMVDEPIIEKLPQPVKPAVNFSKLADVLLDRYNALETTRDMLRVLSVVQMPDVTEDALGLVIGKEPFARLDVCGKKVYDTEVMMFTDTGKPLIKRYLAIDLKVVGH